MKAIDVEEFAQICLDIEKDQKEQGNYANALFISELRKMISTFPTVDAVPVVHGHWEDVGSLSCRCSECGCKNDRETRFCPHCGSKLDLEEQDAEEKT